MPADNLATPAPLQIAPSFEAESTSSTQGHYYPNPGYLGVSSHSTLFNQVSSGDDPEQASFQPASARLMPGSPMHFSGSQIVLDRASHALTRLDRLNISRIIPLVHLWLAKGVNLPLAGPFVAGCLESAQHWKQLLDPDTGIDSSESGSGDSAINYVRALLANTRKNIVMHQDMSTKDFLSQMLGKNLRYESLGICLVAAARAAYDIPSFEPLYSSNEQRHRLINALTYIGDCCLETCLELDCLNDLQLLLQYENFIVHSQVDGDQSKYDLIPGYSNCLVRTWLS